MFSRFPRGRLGVGVYRNFGIWIYRCTARVAVVNFYTTGKTGGHNATCPSCVPAGLVPITELVHGIFHA